MIANPVTHRHASIYISGIACLFLIKSDDKALSTPSSLYSYRSHNKYSCIRNTASGEIMADKSLFLYGTGYVLE